MPYPEEKPGTNKDITSPLLYVENGKYAGLNNSVIRLKDYYQVFPENLTDSILKIKPEEYINTLQKSYAQALDSLNADKNYSGELREYFKNLYQEMTLSYIFRYKSYCEMGLPGSQQHQLANQKTGL